MQCHHHTCSGVHASKTSVIGYGKFVLADLSEITELFSMFKT